MNPQETSRPGRLLCHCLGVTYGEVEETIRRHRCEKVQEVTRLCKAGGGCRSCHADIELVIQQVKKDVRARRPRGLWRWIFSRRADLS